MTVGMQDMLFATVKLVERVGATGFDVGYLNDDEGVSSEDAQWYAQCKWQGAKVTVGGRCSPDEACLALCLRLLSGATCKCIRPVTIDDGEPGCRWRLMGDTWTPSCKVAAITVPGPLGDTAAIGAALGRAMDAAIGRATDDAPNRAARRGQGGRRGKRRHGR